MRNVQTKNGYIALLSAFIMAAFLLLVSVSLSSINFFSRNQILEREQKMQSLAFSQSCIQILLLRLARNPILAVPANVTVGEGMCSIRSVHKDDPVVGQITFEINSEMQQAITNLRIVVDGASLVILSYQEVTNL